MWRQFTSSLSLLKKFVSTCSVCFSFWTNAFGELLSAWNNQKRLLKIVFQLWTKERNSTDVSTKSKRNSLTMLNCTFLLYFHNPAFTFRAVFSLSSLSFSKKFANMFEVLHRIFIAYLFKDCKNSSVIKCRKFEFYNILYKTVYYYMSHCSHLITFDCFYVFFFLYKFKKIFFLIQYDSRITTRF